MSITIIDLDEKKGKDAPEKRDLSPPRRPKKNARQSVTETKRVRHDSPDKGEPMEPASRKRRRHDSPDNDVPATDAASKVVFRDSNGNIVRNAEELYEQSLKEQESIEQANYEWGTGEVQNRLKVYYVYSYS